MVLQRSRPDANGAPFCNVEVTVPGAKPASPKGITHIPQNISQNQLINILNQNFTNLVKGNFIEDRASRQTVITRIFDPQNSGAFVDVRQVVGVNWQNPFTGQTLVWRR